MKIYLAGPINGCNDDEATTWREWFKYCRDQLEPEVMPNGGKLPVRLEGVEWVDPMSRDYRGRELTNYREIVDLDKRDISGSDFIVVMYTKPSVGTSMEVYYAWSIGKPVIVINESGEQVSPWLIYHSTTIVESKEECCDKIKEWQ